MFGERHGATSMYAMVRRACAIVFSIALLAGCHKDPSPPQSNANTADAHPSNAAVDADVHYVGSEACGKCHAEEFTKWRASQHRLAMQVAGADSVLGNFDDA